MKPLNELESQKIVQAFIDRFVDQTTERYKMIKEAKSHGDLVYMWDTLKAPFRRIVKYEQAKDCLQKISRKNVFLLTDREDNVFELTSQEVLELYRDCEDLSKTPSELNLPEDIYVFDGSFDWILVFTHGSLSFAAFRARAIFRRCSSGICPARRRITRSILGKDG